MRTTTQPKQRKTKTVVTSTHGRRRFADAFLTPLPFDGSLLALESRIMFDGAAVATASTVTTEQVAQQQAEAFFTAEEAAAADTAPAAPTGEPQPTNTDLALFDALAAYDASTARQEIVFLSPSVHEYQQLLDGISPNVEVIVLDPARDGMEQMAEVLAGRRDLDAIHIISHGAEAELTLGSARLTLQSMNGVYADELAVIGQSLNEKADLLIYGCNFGQGDLGQQAAGRLAELTGADVAASRDNTGHADLGGDWDLEQRAGDIETALVLSDAVTKEWMGLLAENILESYEPIFTDMSDQAYEIKSDQSWGQTFSYDSPGGTYTVNRIGLVLYRDTAAASQVVTVSLRSSWNGPVIASGQVSSATLGTTEAWVHIDLTTPATLTDNATYYVRVESNTLAGKVFVGVHDAGIYAKGDLINMSGAPETPKDLAFRIIEATANTAPVITNLNGDALAYNEGDGVVAIEQGGNATVSDVDSVDFDTGSLVVSFAAGSDSAEDVLAIRNEGTGAGQIGVSGSNVTYGGVTIGTFAGGSGGANLIVTFNSSATPAAAQALIRNITYQNTDTDAPTTGARTVRFELTDGDGGSSGPHDTTITVTSVNDVPVLTTNSPLPVPEESTQTITSAYLSVTDPDHSPAQIIYTLTSLPGGGTVRLNGSALGIGDTFTQDDINNNRVTYRDSDEGASASFSFTISDGIAVVGPATFVINGQPVNDAPQLDASRSPVLNAIAEDTGPPVGAVGTLISQLVDFSMPAGQVDNVTDPDAGALLGIAVTAADTTDGTWYYSTNNGTSWLALGAVTNTNARLLAADGNTRIYFQPNANYTWTLANAVTFRAWDQTTGTNGGVADTSTNGGTTAFSTATDTAAITVTAVNDAPVNTMPGAQGTPQNTPLVFSTGNGNTITVADADVGVGALQVALSATNGTVLVGPVVGAATVSGDGSATVTITGSIGDVNSALSGMSFTPNLNYNGAASLQISTDDQGNTGAGGPQSDIDTIAITVANNIPAAVSMSAGALTYIENDPPIVVDPNLTVADPDNAVLDHAHMTITGGYVNGQDLLEYVFNPLLPAITASWNAAAGELTLAGAASAAEYQQALRTVTYRNLSEAPSAALRTITVEMEDGISVDAGSFASRTLTVTPVNDAPVGTDVTVTTAEDTPHTFTGLNFGFTDVDAGDSLSAVRIDTLPGAGTLTLFGAAVTAGDVILVTDITAGNLVFTPAPNANGAGYASFTFSVRDQANAFDAAPNTMTIDVMPVNDAPLNTVPGPQVVSEDTPLALGGMGVTDVDGNLSTMQLAVANGTVTVTLQGGASITAGASGTNTLTLAGTEADINATLATLVYQGTLNYTGPETLTITSGDAGNATDLDTVTITVTPVNDAPVITSNGGGATAVVNVPENQAAGTTVTSADVDGGVPAYSIIGGADAALFTLDATTGALTFNNAPDFEAAVDTGANNVYDVTVQVADGSGGTDIQALSIMVTDVNEGLPPPPPPPPIPPPSLVPQPPAPPPGGGPLTSGSPPSQPPIVVGPPISPQPNPGIPVFPVGLDNSPGGTAPPLSEATRAPAPKGGNISGPSVPLMRELRGYLEERFTPLTYQADEEVRRAFGGQTLEKAPAPLSWAFRKTLNTLEEDLRRATDTSERNRQFVVGVTNMGGISLTAGVITWLLRSGSLLASLTATLPAWRHFDPLPVVLVGDRKRRKRKADMATAADHENKQFRGLKDLLDRKGENERSDGEGMAA
ncbi:MAG: DUF4347 domain-containing protein [Nitrospiraceae bacterium]